MRQRLYGDTVVDFHIRKSIINRNARFVDSCNSRPSYLTHDLLKFSGEGFEVDRVIDRAFDDDRFLH
jgi:hypothetical protein